MNHSQSNRVQAARQPELGRILTPASVAIIGFSSKAESPSRACLQNLRTNGFKGSIHLVGRTAGEHDGMPVLASVDELPPDIDLALFLVPAAAVLEAVAGAVRRRVKSGVIFASGFAELGDEERAGQDRIARIAQEGGLTLLGPNCLGYTNYLSALNIGFLPQAAIQTLPVGTRGAVAIVMQSGGLMGHVHRALVAKNVPVAYRISTGNEVDVEIGHFLDHLANDDAVGTFVLYAEQVRNPNLFLAAVRKARAAGKHVVLMHPGRGEKAQQAAASHTGALAPDYRLMATTVRSAGVLLAESLETLVDAAELLVRFPKPPVAGAALLVSSGAYCAHAHDVCEVIGLDLPKFSPDVMATLKSRMPDYLHLDNPFDLTTQGAWDRTLVIDCIKLALSDPKVGSVCLVTPIGGLDAAMHDLEGMLQAQAAQDKPLLFAVLGDDTQLDPKYLQRIREGGLLFSRSSERHLRTLAAVTAYGRQVQDLSIRQVPPPVRSSEPLRPGAMAEWEGKKLLAALEIPLPAGGLAKNPEEARRIANKIGYPVVMKLQSRNLLHKTEIGGVLLGIDGVQAVETGWATLMDRALTAGLKDTVDGILVESMSEGGLEVIVGATRRDGWGPVVMVGLGGVWVEALNDVRVFSADCDAPTIAGELLKLHAVKLLQPFRGAPGRDIDAIAKVAEAVGRLMRGHPEIEEIEINPLTVFSQGRGAVALDALVKVSNERST